MKNKGFSLVELIIVIAITAILSAAIAPALIRYINKARKADDIAAADALGSTVVAAVTQDDDIYDFVNAHAKTLKKKYNSNANNYLRIICWMASGTQTYSYTFNNPGGGTIDSDTLAAGKDKMANVLSELMGEKVFRLKFQNDKYLDQWIICCDSESNIYIFVGGGIRANSHYFIDASTHKMANGNLNHGGKGPLYEIWPETDSKYNMLTVTPNDIEN